MICCKINKLLEHNTNASLEWYNLLWKSNCFLNLYCTVPYPTASTELVAEKHFNLKMHYVALSVEEYLLPILLHYVEQPQTFFFIENLWLSNIMVTTDVFIITDPLCIIINNYSCHSNWRRKLSDFIFLTILWTLVERSNDNSWNKSSINRVLLENARFFLSIDDTDWKLAFSGRRKKTDYLIYLLVMGYSEVWL